jgi:hypothetical protein
VPTADSAVAGAPGPRPPSAPPAPRWRSWLRIGVATIVIAAALFLSTILVPWPTLRVMVALADILSVLLLLLFLLLGVPWYMRRVLRAGSLWRLWTWWCVLVVGLGALALGQWELAIKVSTDNPLSVLDYPLPPPWDLLRAVLDDLLVPLLLVFCWQAYRRLLPALHLARRADDDVDRNKAGSKDSDGDKDGGATSGR